MAYAQETISHSTTGVKTRTFGFQPTGYRITVSAKSGGTTYVNQSVGTSDGTTQVCDSTYADQSRAKSDRYSDRVVCQREWDAGTSSFVTKTRADHDSLTATGIKYNVITADVNYQYKIEAWG